MTVVFYISGHGFGHASRDVEVINRLDDKRIIIRSAVDPALLERTVTTPYELMPAECDTGIVQTTSVEHDDEATVEAALAFYRTFDERIDHEVRALRHAGVEWVVGDI